ncbi:MAG: SBBP repeat-containing protein, partial [Acidobacteria bacterium]|nr:SBBP repeat-containing protein [Acidobacteriota bacterium]
LNAAGSALVNSTFLGGDDRDAGEGVALDAAGNVYVAGFTSSTNFPTVNPLQEKYGGGQDGWVAKLNSDGSALGYSTYLGGSGQEEIVSLAVDPAGNVYVAGQTTSVDYPTVDPLQPTHGGGPNDVFVAKISEILTRDTFYFAQVGGGGGLSTGVFLTNPSTTKSVSATVSFFGSDGRPLEGVVTNAVIPFVIQPSGTAATSTSSQGILRSGYARISSADPVFANATYSIPGLPSLSVAPSAPPAYLFRVPVSRDRSRGIDVGVAAVNVSDQRATAVFSLADSSGRSIRSLRAARILAPGQQVSSSLGDLLPNLPDIFEGSLQIAALSPLPTQSLVVTAVRFGPGLFNAVRLTSLAKPVPWEKENAE